VIECENLIKIYKAGELEVVALQGLDLKVEKGELMAVIGNSGSGKSTLLNLIGGLDRPSAGKLCVDGKEIFKFTERQLNDYRRFTIGFVWQNPARNLVPYLSAFDNVLLPMAAGDAARNEAWARELLDRVGLAARSRHRPAELSGGEQQRTAVAVALANRPKVLLADEPTGSVDAAAAAAVLDLFRRLNAELGLTVVIVTHDLALSKKVGRVAAIRDGKVGSEFIHKKYFLTEYERVRGRAWTDAGESHIEMAVLDGAGRLQLPREYLEDLKARGHDKLLVSKEGEKIVLSVPKRKPSRQSSKRPASRR
jgi:ABC-type lipoprotein export system ATPase subunit